MTDQDPPRGTPMCDRWYEQAGDYRPWHSRAATGGDTAIRLLEEALFLRMNGERPPGAPHDNPEAETWRDWDRKAEAFLRTELTTQGEPGR